MLNENLHGTSRQLTEPDELTVTDIFRALQKLIRRVWKNKARVFVVCLASALLGFGYAHFFRKLNYVSSLTFAVEEKSSTAGLTGLASQFGLDVGGNGGGLFSSDNLMLLLKSKRIIHQTLLEPLPEWNGKTLFNRYLELSFGEALKLGDVTLIPEGKQQSLFSRQEDSLLNVVSDGLLGKLTISKYDKKASIIYVEVIGTDEEWTFKFNEMLIKQAVELYQEIKVGRSRRTVIALNERVDSVKNELDKVMAATAIANDRNQAVVLMQAKVPAAKSQLQVQLLTAMYSELVKNLEVSKLSLEREEPVIEVIDKPSMPLEKEGKGRLKFAILFGFFAFVLLVLYYALGDFIAESWKMAQQD